MPRTAAVCVAMAILLLVGCVGGLSVSAAEKPSGTVLYVATDGNDAWSGKLPAPNADKTDGPLATLARARDAIRVLKKAGPLPGGGVTVLVRAGTYELAAAFELTKADSGEGAERPIVYRAEKGAEVRLCGGKVVADWQPVADKAVLDRLDPAARGTVVQADLKALGITDYGSPKGGGLELFLNDQPMQIARWPNDGFIKITGLVEPNTVNVRGTKGSKAGKFLYAGDRPKRWAAEKDAWVHGYWFWDWSDQRHPVESIDTAKHIIAVKPPYHGYGYRVGQWFYGLNLLSEIDQPGEWYLDRQAGLLYFWPPASVKTGRAVVSVIPTLVTMKDASHVSLGGMVLENCRGTAVSASGGTHVAIQACTMRNLGGYAVRISGATDSGVFGCDIYGTGEGGIALSGGDRKTLTPARLVADNNHIHHYGRWNRMYKAGIHLGGVGNRASHNLIHNAPHMAINFGGNEHVIEFNEIHSVCHESNDAGAMYAGRNWTMRGTVVRHNYLHHINGFEGRGCVGVYLDDMFCGTTITGNVFYKVTRAAFIGGGRDCTVTNNIFVDCPRALHIDGRALGWAKGHSEGWVKEGREKRTHLGIKFLEPPYSTRYPPLKTVLDDEPFAPKGNVVARNIFVGQQWNDINHQAKKYVTLKDNLIDEDPHFVAPPPRSFVLKDDSPAYKLGFQRIPVEKIGLVNDGRRASWPVTHAVRPMVEPKIKPRVPKGKAPVFRVPRTKGALHADGADPKKAMLLQQGVQGQKTKPTSRAWLGHDGTTLFVAIDNAVAAKPALKRDSVWGQNDAVELAFQNPALGKAAPILILRGYPNGKWQSSDEADAPAAAVKKATEGVQFAAKVASPTRWTAEWAIPLASLGIDPAKRPKIRFNLSVRKTAQGLWLMWEGTRGYSWRVDQAGILEWGK